MGIIHLNEGLETKGNMSDRHDVRKIILTVGQKNEPDPFRGKNEDRLLGGKDRSTTKPLGVGV